MAKKGQNYVTSYLKKQLAFNQSDGDFNARLGGASLMGKFHHPVNLDLGLDHPSTAIISTFHHTTMC